MTTPDQPDFTSSTTINGGTITVEPGAQVTVEGIVTANVVPKVADVGNYTADTNGIDVTGANALVIVTDVVATAFSATDWARVDITAYDSASGLVLPTKSYYVHSCTYNNNASNNGNGAQTIFPLHGMDRVNIAFATNDAANVTVSAQMLSTTETLPESHRTEDYDTVSHILSANANHIMPSGGSTFPIPVSSKPVRLYIEPHGGNTGASQVIQVIDVITGVRLFTPTVPKGNGIGWGGLTNPPTPWIQLPHTMSPLYMVTGSATAGDMIDVFMTDDV